MSPVVTALIQEIQESLKMALVALRTNKLRSSLTLLGIAVGVFSIIGVMTAMGVLVNSIESGMSFLGANTFQIQKYPMFNSGNPQDEAKLRNRKDISYDQAVALKERSTLAKGVGLFTGDWGKMVSTPSGTKTNHNVSVTGRDIEGFMANNWNIGDGRLYTQQEIESARRVAVIGFDIAKKLFPRSDPIDQTIRIDGVDYRVIGVVEKRGGMLGSDGDYFVTVPITTYFNVYGNNRNINIKVMATDAGTYDDCIEETRAILRAARHVPPGNDDDFYIFSNDSMISQFNDITKYVRLGIMLVSAIALVAAGVGIMNIMLVSVTERTREIGIRKAIGARKSNVLTQFLLEAVVISELGGLIGIGLGVVAGNMLAIFMEIPPVIPFDWVLIGFASCSLIGIIFGVYPAWKASNLDPIEALRYE